MKRKLIAQRDSLTLTLPKEWTSSLNLKSGDEIEVNELEKTLTINALKKEKEKEYTLDVSDMSDTYVRNELNALYVLSATKIIINSNKPSKLLLCKKIISLFLIGFEITKEEENRVVAESLAIPSENNFEKFFLKLFNFLEFSFNALDEYATNKKNDREEIRRDTKKVTQYSNICDRILLGNPVSGPNNIVVFEMVSQLKEINHLIFYLLDKKKRISTQEANVLKRIFLEIRKGYFKKDPVKINDAQGELMNSSKILEENSYVFTISRALYNLSNSVIRLSRLK